MRRTGLESSHRPHQHPGPKQGLREAAPEDTRGSGQHALPWPLDERSPHVSQDQQCNAGRPGPWQCRAASVGAMRTTKDGSAGVALVRRDQGAHRNATHPWALIVVAEVPMSLAASKSTIRPAIPEFTKQKSTQTPRDTPSTRFIESMPSAW